MNDLGLINLTASLAWAPPAGHCPPPWPPGLRVEWACIWRGRPCESSDRSLAAALAEANSIINAATVPASWAGWASILSLVPEALSPSLSPYVFSATAFVAGTLTAQRPLLRRELAVFVESAGDGGAGEYDSGGGPSLPSSPSAHRRSQLEPRPPFFDSMTGHRLQSWQGARASISTAVRWPSAGGPKYTLRLASAAVRGWDVEVSKQEPPVNGRCQMWWDGWEAGGLVVGALLECGGWIGRDADAYPLAYEFGLQYRYEIPWLCLKPRD
jgi:hypothetical protein